MIIKTVIYKDIFMFICYFTPERKNTTQYEPTHVRRIRRKTYQATNSQEEAANDKKQTETTSFNNSNSEPTTINLHFGQLPLTNKEER